MSKRFTDTDKWSDLWFRNLPVKCKLLWCYLCDNCDQSGVIELDFPAFSFYVGDKIDDKSMSYFKDRIRYLSEEKVLIIKFIQFQYGKLSENCKPHIPVFRCLERHGIDLSAITENDRYSQIVEDSMRRKIIERDGLICVYENIPISPSDVVVDHIVPRVFGGTCSPSNLVVCSARMNGLKGSLSVDDFCLKMNFDVESVIKRINERIAKPLNTYYKGFQCLQEKEEDKEKEKDKEKDKRSVRMKNDCYAEIPDCLSAVEGFAETFSAFLENRKAMKKPATVRAQNLILKDLAERPNDACAALNLSIKRGWQGVEWAWYDKEKPVAPKTGPSSGEPSYADQLDAAIERSAIK